MSVPVEGKGKTYLLLGDRKGRPCFLQSPLTLRCKLKHPEDSVLGWPDSACDYDYMVWAIRMFDVVGGVPSNPVPELLSYFPTPETYWVSYRAGWRVVPDHALFRAAMRPKVLELFKAWKRMSAEERDAGENCLTITMFIGGNMRSIRLPAFPRRLSDSILFLKWDPDAVPHLSVSPPLPRGPCPSDPPRPPEPAKDASVGSGTSTSPLLLDGNSEEGRAASPPNPASSPGTPPPSSRFTDSEEDASEDPEDVYYEDLGASDPEDVDYEDLGIGKRQESSPEEEASSDDEPDAQFTDPSSDEEAFEDPEDVDYEDLGVGERQEIPPAEAEEGGGAAGSTETTPSKGRETGENPTTRKGAGSAKRKRVDEDAGSPPDEGYSLNDAMRENNAKRRKLARRLKRLETSKKQLSESRRRVHKAKWKLLDACTERMSSFLDRKRTAIDTEAVDGLLSSLERYTSEIRGASRGSEGNEM